jgi:hypothetical protein
MTRSMNHDDARDALMAAALEALSADDQSAVLAHATACAECGPELDALRQALGTLGSATPPPVGPVSQDMDRRLTQIQRRLMARVQPDTVPAPKRARPSTWAAWVALAAAVVIAGFLYDQNISYRRTVTALHDHLAVDSATLDSARTRIASRDREIAALTGPRTAVVALSRTGALEPSALMFWDRTDDRWAFYAHHLKPPPVGKTYQLWLVTPSTKISGGTFAPAADSSIELHMTYALPPDSLRAVAVTEEPAGGVPQPTGPMVIVGVCRQCAGGEKRGL